MFPTVQTVIDSLAKAVGAKALPANPDGGVPLTVGDDTVIILYGEDSATILAAAAIAELPRTLDYGSALWLLRRNFYESPIAPFRVACDTAGNVVLWGRIPIDGMSGEQLAKILDNMAAEADLIRSEIATEAEAAA